MTALGRRRRAPFAWRWRVALGGLITVAVVTAGCTSGSDGRTEEAGEVVEAAPEAVVVVTPPPNPTPVAAPTLESVPTSTPTVEPRAPDRRSPSPWPEAFELFDRVRARMAELGFSGEWRRTPFTLVAHLTASDEWDHRPDVIVTLHDGATPDLDAPTRPDEPRLVWVDCGTVWITVGESAIGEWNIAALVDLSEALGDDDCGRERTLHQGAFVPGDLPINLDDERVLLARFDRAKYARLGADGIARFEDWRDDEAMFFYDIAAAEAGQWPFTEIGDRTFDNSRLPSGVSAGTSVLDWPSDVEVVNESDGAIISRVLLVPGTAVRLGIRAIDPVEIEGDGPGHRWVVDAIDDGVDEFVGAVRDPNAHYFVGPPVFGPDSIVVWGMYNESGPALHAARITSDGFLVDIHDVVIESDSPLAPGRVYATWYGFTDDGQLLAIGSQYAPSHNGGSNGHLPNHGRVDVAEGPYWVASELAVELDRDRFTTFDDGAAWFVGSDPTSAESRCGPNTLFLDTPDGPVLLTERGVGFDTLGKPVGFTVENDTHRSEWRAFTVTCATEPDRIHVVLVGRPDRGVGRFEVSRCPVLAIGGLDRPPPYWDLGPPLVVVEATAPDGADILLGEYRDLMPLSPTWRTDADCPEHGLPAATPPGILRLVDGIGTALAREGLELTAREPVVADEPFHLEAQRPGGGHPKLSLTVLAGRDGFHQVVRHDSVLTVRDGMAIIVGIRDRIVPGPGPTPFIHTWCGRHMTTLTSVGGQGTPFTVDELIEFARAIAPACNEFAS